MAGPGPPIGWERPPGGERCKSRRSRSARGSAIWGSMWLEGRRLLLLRLGSRLTSSRPTGALLDPWVPTAFYPGPGILAGPALQSYLDLSPAFARAEVRAGECTLQCLRPVLLGIEPGKSRPCVEMGRAGGGSTRETPTGPSSPASSFPAKIPRALEQRFLFPPHPQPFLERDRKTPAYGGPMQVRGGWGDAE